MRIISRKNFLTSLTGATGILMLPSILKSQQLPQQTPQQKGPPLDPAQVREFVGQAHKDAAKVKAMFQENPDLLNGVHNLGGWDWEDAVGASGHVGNRELTIFLLEQGARPTICVAAMLGKTDVVKSFITAFPQMKEAVGPHKISLVRHAKAGGEAAKETLDYLISVGAKE